MSLERSLQFFKNLFVNQPNRLTRIIKDKKVKWIILYNVLLDIDLKGAKELNKFVMYCCDRYFSLKSAEHYSNNIPKIINNVNAFIRIIEYIYEQYPNFNEVIIEAY